MDRSNKVRSISEAEADLPLRSFWQRWDQLCLHNQQHHSCKRGGEAWACYCCCCCCCSQCQCQCQCQGRQHRYCCSPSTTGLQFVTRRAALFSFSILLPHNAFLPASSSYSVSASTLSQSIANCVLCTWLPHSHSTNPIESNPLMVEEEDFKTPTSFLGTEARE